MDYSRQHGVFNPDDFKFPVHIIGCGATGSWVAMLLAKMGIQDIHLHDFDRVEEHNLPNQLFNTEHIDRPKIFATAQMIYNCSKDTAVSLHEDRVTGETPLQGIVFVLTDTMSSREDIFKKALKNNIHVPLVIETRMGGEGGRIYAVNPCDKNQVNQYQQTLYSDEDSVVSACGVSQSLAPTAAMIAGLAVWQLIKFHNDQDIDNEIIIDAQYNTYLSKKF